MAKYIMALDAGTTSNRCILFDKAGKVCSVAQKEFTQIFPKPGWVEHDADEIFSTQLEVAKQAMANIGANVDKDVQRLGLLMEGAEITAIPVEGVFNSVTSAYTMVKDGATYYGLVSRSYGYANEVMGVYYVIDENGAIVAMNADELIFHAEYFNAYTLDPAAYKAGFKGLTSDSWTGEQAVISGATMTSDAVKTSTNDIFAAYEILKGGAAE